jgi:hypothetical protein
MIWYYAILFTGNMLTAVLSAFHLPIVRTLPYGMDEALTNAVGYFNFIRDKVPFVNVIFIAFLVYLGFKVTLFFLRHFRIYVQ